MAEKHLDVTLAVAVPREVVSNGAQRVQEEPSTTPQWKQNPSPQPSAPVLYPQHTRGPPPIKVRPITTPSKQQKPRPSSQPTPPVHPPQHPLGLPPIRGPCATTPSKQKKRSPSPWAIAPVLPPQHTRGPPIRGRPATTPSKQQKRTPSSQPTPPVLPPQHTLGPPPIRGPCTTTPSRQRKRKPYPTPPVLPLGPPIRGPSITIPSKQQKRELPFQPTPPVLSLSQPPIRDQPVTASLPPESSCSEEDAPLTPCLPTASLSSYPLPPPSCFASAPVLSLTHTSPCIAMVTTNPSMNSSEKPLDEPLVDVHPEKLDQPCRDDHLTAPLSMAHYQAVRKALWKVRPQWRNIGLALGFPVHKLNEFSGSLEDKMDKMLEVWLHHTYSTPTWGALVNALRDETVEGGKPVAVRIEGNCICGGQSMPERSSLEELLKDVPCEKLNQPCRDDHLNKIALSITDWQSIAPFLGLTEAEEEEIKRDYPNTKTQRISMLRKWKKRVGRKAKYRKLASVFWDLERTDLVEKVCKLLQTETSSSSSEEEDVHSEAKNPEKSTFDSYAEYLRGRYSTEPPKFFTLQWPPPPTRKVFNLAMIGHQTVQRGPADEELVRLTLRGNVDDIMKMKTSVELKNLFKLDHSKRKIILIEGAPGAGKSTLAWHIVQKWESGELFQEFKVVVFVQLRDPAIQSAKSVADLIPARSNNMRVVLQSNMEACDGRGVLFVLDGWDEYGPGLQHRSLFQHLICSPGEVNMHFCSFIITSRPIASGELQRYASSRVEIIGFSSSEVNKYFIECIRDNEQQKPKRQGESETVQKFQDHLRERPVIEASCYLPLNAAIIVHLYLSLNHTLPHTLHEVFLSLVCCCITRHLTREAEEGENVPDILTLDDLPPDVLKLFNNICIMAYYGVMENKATFSVKDLRSFNLPTKFSTLSLIQGVQDLAAKRTNISFNFLHLSVQELLAACHISELSAAEQIQIFNDLFDQPRLAAVFRFYAAFTKLKTEGVARIVQKQEKPLLVNLLHGLYEAQDVSLCQFVASHLEGRLDLSDNTLSPMDSLVVGYFLSCVCLTTSGEFKVNLSNCSLDNYRVSFLVKGLSKCSSSTGVQTATGDGVPGCLVMDVSNNRIGEKRVKPIGEALMKNRSLQVPDLHDNPISAGVVHLAESLKRNHSLLEIDLSNCHITEKEAQSLAISLKENTFLQVLLLERNKLSDGGAAHLADGLRHNTCLKKLDVPDCRLSDHSIKSLGSALEVNSSLEELDLSMNIAVTGFGLIALGESLKRNRGLKTLRLGGLPNISENDWKRFMVCLQENNDLTKLGISSSALTVVLEEITTLNHSRRKKGLPPLLWRCIR